MIAKHSTTSDLDDPLTPQNKCMCWLLEEIDEIDSIDELKIFERHNIAKICFNTNGELWNLRKNGQIIMKSF